MNPGWQARSVQALAWVWAAPGTLLGLLALALTRMSGGQVRRHGSTLEAHGGVTGRLLAILAGRARVVDAIALGHIVLARDAESLAACRAHERVHVRQWERWGVGCRESHHRAAPSPTHRCQERKPPRRPSWRL